MGGPIPLPVTRALANLCAARAGVNLAQVVTDYAVAQRGKQVMGASAAPDQGTYKPPFRNVDTVPININATAYELKRRFVHIRLRSHNLIELFNLTLRSGVCFLLSGYLEPMGLQ